MRRTYTLSLIGSLAAAIPAFAQAYIQGGNALDANTRVNSGGLNYGGRQYQGNWGNRIISGNAAGGMSFRGYSGIQDPSTLFIRNYATSDVTSSGLTSGLGLSSLSNRSGLPSDTLYSFRRDSTDIATIRQGQLTGGNRLPYYSATSTVANTGAIIAGLNKPGSSQLLSPYTPARASTVTTPINPLSTAGSASGSALALSPRLVRIDNGQSLTGKVNEHLLGSALFGAVREVPLDQLADTAQRGSGGALRPNPFERRQDKETIVREQAPLTGRLTGDQQTTQSPSANPPGAGVASLRHGMGETGVQNPGTLRQPVGPGAVRPAGPADVTVRGAAGTGLTDAQLLAPLKSFVGSGETLVSRKLSEAEDLLKRGQYYRAADSYEAARIYEPGNPLPVLGKAVALLGAGDYVSSANFLFTGIRLYDQMPRLHLDLKSLIPDHTLLETRRTDLEKRLQAFDDFRLRFLLGYLEYSTGQEEAGIRDMEQAVQKLPPAEFGPVQKFVDVLRGRQKARADSPATRPG